MNSRLYIVAVILVTLLIWGPIDDSWPAWLAIRITYLITIPLIAWLLLKWIWRLGQPDAYFENRLERALASATGGVLSVQAIIEATATKHVSNTMWIRTRDGMEAVGDDIVRTGPNWGVVIVLIFIAACAFWFSIAKRESKQ